jgi:hypothetical protein
MEVPQIINRREILPAPAVCILPVSIVPLRS